MPNLLESDKLLNDWIDILKDYITHVMGINTSKINHDADMWLANRMHRLPRINPRKIWLSDVFKCPEELELGWLNLKNKIESGDDLEPHLSRGINRLDDKDGMLSHWGVNHFHLGIEKDLKHPNLVQGGKSILYAILDDDNFYAISILGHGHWEDVNLLDVTKRNWPNMIFFNHSLKEISPSFDDDFLFNSRKNNFNTVTRLNDDSFFISHGVTVAGTSTMSAFKACHVRRIWGGIQFQVEEILSKDNLSENKLDASLILNEDKSTFSVYLPQLNRKINVDEKITIQNLINSFRS
ncbi:hypothetical protein [Pectobacterium aroidearum]|uniref:hypothetical protein n=1 Tax=Pectobacterium aroidearum TaxID=1201031 RepID=UPI0032ECAC9F